MGRPGRQPWSTRTARDRTDSATRAALLDAAEDLFAEQGYKQSPIAAIAQRAGTSRATFYVYFSSREEVFRALAERVRDEITAVQRVAGRGSTDPRVVIGTSIRAALAVYARKNRFITVMQHQALTDPGVAELWREVQNAPSRVNAEFIGFLCAEHGARPAASARTVAEVVAAALVHLAAQAADDPARLDELGRDLVEVYLRLVGLPPTGAGHEQERGEA
ncbi:TetR/AcrR family transcriptional regulator [Pseudonocardia abyssalis]|uniref:TetR/AcrR family transcriptional regulator n=1 Tax=Pseudonocardia abyssalis TaxID=2792008 RepID=A0ABS6UR84_9PSEU|nr:TetR/AcrR family transcriptional regulator [Pseudonocardia abyssalis]MBW0118514.1 TetR/AcrR family transcriptional regulator [Pseudonocardia abyssalis]MBW0134770.1 TetR/AcrR family transcriptional regulator [Pseudonocardia abyssalis]